MVKKILLLLLVPILGIFLLPSFSKADSPDSYSKSDGLNSGVVSENFNPNVSKVWSIPNYPQSPPIIAGNNIFYLDFLAGRAEDYIRSKNIYSEKNVWSYSVSISQSICPPVYDSGLIYTCDKDIVVLDANSGNEIRRYISVGNKFDRVVSAGNLIVGFSSAYNRTIAFDKMSGLVVWARPINKPPLGAVIFSEGKLVFNSNPSYGETDAINIIDGSFAWRVSHIGTVGDLVYSPESRRLYDTSRDWSMDIEDGTKRAASTGRGWPFVVDGKLVSYYSYGQNIAFMIKDSVTGATISRKYDVVRNESFGSKPVMAGNKIYAITFSNRLLEFDLEGNCLNATTATKLNEYDGFQGQIIIDHGRLITYDTWHQEISYYDKEKIVLSSPETIKLISPYTSYGIDHQYLGQLHSHYIPDIAFWSKLFNGEPSPSFTVGEYQKKGYDFMALTEHNQIVPMPVDGSIMQIQNAEESTQGIGRHHLLAIGVTSAINDSADDQTRINAILSQGGIPIFAHPDSWVYGALSQTIDGLSGIKFLEIYNNAIRNSIIPDAYALDDFDYLISRGNNKFLTAGDDYTPGDGFIDGGSVVVNAQTNTQPDILSNLKTGNFYANEGSNAPRISNIGINGTTINISANEPSTVSFIGKGGQTLQKTADTYSASYQVQGDEIYVRAEVASKEFIPKHAWTQPIIISKTKTNTTNVAGSFDIPLTQGVLKSITTEAVSTSLLEKENYPANLPPLGYLSPIYQLSTTGQVLEGTKLSINYDPNSLSVSPTNLSLYTLNETTSIWEKVPSFVDTTTNTVSAELLHFSLYTLSGEVPTDTTAPTVILSEPTNLQDLSGEVSLKAEANDNQAVISVSYLIDDKLLSSDSLGEDGWTATLNSSDFTVGQHKLLVTAEDYSGNRGENEYQLSILGGVVAPTVSVVAPQAGEQLFEPSAVTGSFTSELAVREIGVYLDGVFIDNADLDSNTKTFTKLVDWKLYKEGEHQLKLVLADQKANTTESEITINIGQQVTANIVSPQNKGYLRNTQLKVDVQTMPLGSPVVVTVDGQVVQNNGVLDLIQYSLGNHLLEVKFQDKLITSTQFGVVTSYSDTRATVDRLYKEGHINNFGIANSIKVRLLVAELLSRFRLNKLKKLELNNLVSFINQQSQVKKPKIDGYSKRIVVEDILWIKNR